MARDWARANAPWLAMIRPILAARRPSMPHSQSTDIKNSGLKATLPRIKILEVFQRARNSVT